MAAERAGGVAVTATERQSVAQRLMQKRKELGYRSATQFAKENGFNATSYAHNENGTRPITLTAAKVYAERLAVSPVWLLFGDIVPAISRLPVVGAITEAGKVQSMGRASGKKLPPTIPIIDDLADLVAHAIIGDALYPTYCDGDYVLHKRLDPIGFDVRLVHGLACIVRMADGTELLRWITVQTDGRVSLHTPSSPEQYDQDIIAAEPIRMRLLATPRSDVTAPFVERGDPVAAV